MNSSLDARLDSVRVRVYSQDRATTGGLGFGQAQNSQIFTSPVEVVNVSGSLPGTANSSTWRNYYW